MNFAKLTPVNYCKALPRSLSLSLSLCNAVWSALFLYRVWPTKCLWPTKCRFLGKKWKYNSIKQWGLANTLNTNPDKYSSLLGAFSWLIYKFNVCLCPLKKVTKFFGKNLKLKSYKSLHLEEDNSYINLGHNDSSIHAAKIYLTISRDESQSANSWFQLNALWS